MPKLVYSVNFLYSPKFYSFYPTHLQYFHSS